MSLRTYIIKRLLLFLPLFLAVTSIVFSLSHLSGNPVDVLIEMHPSAHPELNKQARENLIKRYGLDKPVYIQYFIWLSNVFQGDLGHSIVYNAGVSWIIRSRIFNTFKITLPVLAIAYSLAIILGVFSAVKQYSKMDKLFSLVALFGWSMPTFWIALVAIVIFSLRLDLLPVSGMQTIYLPGQYPPLQLRILDQLQHLILPVLCLTFGFIASTFRLVRSCVLEVLRQDYITTARAKGVKDRIVTYKHALRNALLPVVTQMGMSIGFLFGGSAMIETVFAWPGIGRLAVQSALSRDYMTLLASITIMSLVIIISNLVTDIAYGFLDPRVRY